MRTLSVEDHVFPLLDDDALNLARSGVIYECGDASHDHDFHLNPDFDDAGSGWGTEDLLLAIGRAHGEWENGKTLPVSSFSMSAEVPKDVREKLENDDAWDKRKEYFSRNLSLNVATGATKAGLFDLTEKVDEGGTTTLTVTATLIPPQKRGAFSAISRLYVISLIDALPGVSDQRKEDAISLIQMLK